MEQSKEVKVYKVEYQCDNCMMGQMVRPDGVVLMTYPAKYPHKCNVCDYCEVFHREYPTYEYR